MSRDWKGIIADGWLTFMVFVLVLLMFAVVFIVGRESRGGSEGLQEVHRTETVGFCPNCKKPVRYLTIIKEEK